MTTETAPHFQVPFYPKGSTFLVGVEVLLWSLYTIGFIMVMVVAMMQ